PKLARRRCAPPHGGARWGYPPQAGERRAIRLLRPTDLVGALVVLESHRHVLRGTVDADVTVERGALFDGGILAMVALDVFDVLGAIPIGFVAEDLLHT